ncbi:MAG: hypothetical protein HZB18_06930 [Chloroflexi bacterium]|nr:hypothetical protein [Chloroflexota bacterium]
MPLETKVALTWKINNRITHQARLAEWTITKPITQQAPFPLGKGGGIGHIPSSSPFSFSFPHPFGLMTCAKLKAKRT